jgi:hypothetical protein
VTWRRALLALALGLSAAVVADGCGSGAKTKTVTTTRTQQAQTIAVVVPSQGATVATTSTGTVPGTGTVSSIGSTSAAGIIRPFAANSPWNTSIEAASRDPNSDRMMRFARERIGAIETGSGNTSTTSSPGSTATTQRRLLNDPLFINEHRWTPVVVDESTGVPTQTVCRQIPLPPPNDYCGDGWLINGLPIPFGDDPHPEFDGWYSVLDRRAGIEYDFWRARRSTTSSAISYQFMREWDLNGPGFLVPNEVSARGSGLPYMGGLILPEEIEAGHIDHALAMSVPAPAQHFYVQPASSTDGNGRTTSLPEGARIRLKPGVTLRSIENRFVEPRCNDPLFGVLHNTRKKLCAKYTFPSRTNKSAARALITALHVYGAIVVDRAAVPTLYAKFNGPWGQCLRDPNGNFLNSNGQPFTSGSSRTRQCTPLLRGNELQGIRLTDFEVVKLPPVHRFPNPNEAAEPLSNGAVGQQTASSKRAPRGARRRRHQTFQPAGGGG